jgi:hypothetical protein
MTFPERLQRLKAGFKHQRLRFIRSNIRTYIRSVTTGVTPFSTRSNPDVSTLFEASLPTDHAPALPRGGGVLVGLQRLKTRIKHQRPRILRRNWGSVHSETTGSTALSECSTFDLGTLFGTSLPTDHAPALPRSMSALVGLQRLKTRINHQRPGTLRSNYTPGARSLRAWTYAPVTKSLRTGTCTPGTKSPRTCMPYATTGLTPLLPTQPTPHTGVCH